MKVAVIGGGASGMMCSGKLAECGVSVDLFESNEKLGKKLYITGKGRCNVTNSCSSQEFLENIITNQKFLYSSINSFTSDDTINFFEKLGVPLKVERGNRVFPLSDKSSDIISALKRFIEKNGVNVHLNTTVLDIKKQDELFEISTTSGMYKFYDATIICTGGKTYSATGSTGDGYLFAKKFGHEVVPITPALVPIVLKDEYINQIEGLSLKNVLLSASVNGKAYKSLFGEMLFTSNGISGPIALSMSSYITKKENIKLFIDFKPALGIDKLIERIIRDVSLLKDKQISSLLQGLLPKSLVYIFLNKLSIDAQRKVRTLNANDIKNIANLLKCFELSYAGLDKLDYGIITSGGVDVKEINPKTMESKLVDGLYFAGEVIDVDALTGGFNLQIAWCTAMAVVRGIIKQNNL